MILRCSIKHGSSKQLCVQQAFVLLQVTTPPQETTPGDIKSKYQHKSRVHHRGSGAPPPPPPLCRYAFQTVTKTHAFQRVFNDVSSLKQLSTPHTVSSIEERQSPSARAAHYRGHRTEYAGGPGEACCPNTSCWRAPSHEGHDGFYFRSFPERPRLDCPSRSGNRV